VSATLCRIDFGVHGPNAWKQCGLAKGHTGECGSWVERDDRQRPAEATQVKDEVAAWLEELADYGCFSDYESKMRAFAVRLRRNDAPSQADDPADIAWARDFINRIECAFEEWAGEGPPPSLSVDYQSLTARLRLRRPEATQVCDYCFGNVANHDDNCSRPRSGEATPEEQPDRLLAGDFAHADRMERMRQRRERASRVSETTGKCATCHATGRNLTDGKQCPAEGCPAAPNACKAAESLNGSASGQAKPDVTYKTTTKSGHHVISVNVTRVGGEPNDGDRWDIARALRGLSLAIDDDAASYFEQPATPTPGADPAGKRLADLLVVLSDMHRHHKMCAEEDEVRCREVQTSAEQVMIRARGKRDRLFATKLGELLVPMPSLDSSGSAADPREIVKMIRDERDTYQARLDDRTGPRGTVLNYSMGARDALDDMADTIERWLRSSPKGSHDAG
jgi:hypothetical protein